MSTIKYWYLGGDIHADWRPVRNWVVNELSTPKEESALILLGDVGLNYFIGKRDSETKSKLNKLGIKIFCLRGNHEMRIAEARNYCNYRQYYNLDIGGNVWIEDGYPNLYFLQDYGGLYQIQDKSILVVPGAYSVDKEYRLHIGLNWFPDEQLKENERIGLNIFAHDMDFDYIFAHTCPYSWEKYINDLFLGGLDQSRIDKTMEKFLDTLLEDCSYKYFYFGHFHDDRDIPEVNATMLYHKIIPLGCTLKQVNE